MVEIFCGLLGGTPAGKNCRQWRESHKAANLAQCFVAIDPECFAPGFSERLQSFLDQNRNLESVDPEKPVMVAGDPERKSEERCKRAGGLIYGKRQIDKLVSSSEPPSSNSCLLKTEISNKTQMRYFFCSRGPLQNNVNFKCLAWTS